MRFSLKYKYRTSTWYIKNISRVSMLGRGNKIKHILSLHNSRVCCYNPSLQLQTNSWNCELILLTAFDCSANMGFTIWQGLIEHVMYCARECDLCVSWIHCQKSESTAWSLEAKVAGCYHIHRC